MIELEKVQDTDKIRYILDKGAESVGSDGEFSVTPDQFNEILDRSDEILSAFDITDIEMGQDQDLVSLAENYIDQIPYRDSESVAEQVERLSDSVDDGRREDINAAGLIYTASLVSN